MPYPVRPRRLLPSLLPPLHQEVGQSNPCLIQTKNTCPLCRQRFLHLEHKSKRIEVQDIPERPRPERVSLRTEPPQPQHLLYLPFLIYPNSPCLIYAPHSSIFIQSALTSHSITFSYPPPTLFAQGL